MPSRLTIDSQPMLWPAEPANVRRALLWLTVGTLLAGCSNRITSPTPPPPHPPIPRTLNEEPAWSHDGASLLYLHWAQNGAELALGATQIWKYDFASKSHVLLCQGIDPQWTPGDTAFTFTAGGAVNRYSFGRRVIEPIAACEKLCAAGRPSPDGNYLAYVSNCSPIAGDAGFVWIKNLVTGASRPIGDWSSSTGTWGIGWWSPDGGRLAHLRYDRVADAWQLCIMDTSGGGFVELQSQPHTLISSPRWSYDGSWIYYAHWNDVIDTDGVWRIQPDGTGAGLVVHGGKDVTISPADTALAFCKLDSTTNSFDIWTSRSDGTGARRLFPEPVAVGISSLVRAGAKSRQMPLPRESIDAAWTRDAELRWGARGLLER